ncbi:beta-glucosidase [Acetivibrio straminisolvens JCM 21531]|uniref:Beta-glucosidase n=1 Tax=Acetivibrio straminisolvens JCM 21531 TaxID=1294263 RepID=W4V973_9FIRM|nr:beta-glucosidase [Acetivibrio straminisolvens JCM 21531]
MKEDANMADINNSIPATCFPSAAGLASSWDRELLEKVGAALGEECQAENVSILLGPGANIKRSPLCGRNFEYFSEDPYLSSEMAASHIKGVQSQGVGTSLKHFAANNQEYRRMTVDAVVDERTLREIYFASFESAVKKARPWTVMCAYNKLNGEYCSENRYLLTDILKDEWMHEGFVVSDWGAVNDRVNGLDAGLDLEMPQALVLGIKK